MVVHKHEGFDDLTEGFLIRKLVRSPVSTVSTPLTGVAVVSLVDMDFVAHIKTHNTRLEDYLDHSPLLVLEWLEDLRCILHEHKSTRLTFGSKYLTHYFQALIYLLIKVFKGHLYLLVNKCIS